MHCGKTKIFILVWMHFLTLPPLSLSTPPACTELPKNAHGLEPSTFVSISCVTPPDTRWSKSGQTEIIDQNSNPFFLTTIAFETSRNISPITRLRANIYEVQDRNIHKVSLLLTFLFEEIYVHNSIGSTWRHPPWGTQIWIGLGCAGGCSRTLPMSRGNFSKKGTHI